MKFIHCPVQPNIYNPLFSQLHTEASCKLRLHVKTEDVKRRHLARLRVRTKNDAIYVIFALKSLTQALGSVMPSLVTNIK